MVSSCCGAHIPLDFAGKLNGTSDVTAVQVELRVEVFLSCDGGGIVRTGTLRHVALKRMWTGAVSDSAHQKLLQTMSVVREEEMWRHLPHCELYVAQQSRGKTAEESLSLKFVEKYSPFHTVPRHVSR